MQEVSLALLTKLRFGYRKGTFYMDEELAWNKLGVIRWISGVSLGVTAPTIPFDDSEIKVQIEGDLGK